MLNTEFLIIYISQEYTQMFYDKKGAYCGCAPGIDTPAPSRCNSCSTCRMSRYPDGRGAKCSCIADKCKGKCDAAGCPAEAVQKKIWKQVRVPTSLFTMARSAITVRGGPANLPQQRWGMVNWNQMSDREPHIYLLVVALHRVQRLLIDRVQAGTQGGAWM